MKKIFLVLIVLFFVSCTEKTSPYQGEASKEKTTLHVLENIDSSAQVSIVNKRRIYALRDGLVIYQGPIENKTNAIVGIHEMLLIICLFVAFIIGFFDDSHNCT